jgi:hypothetical protein
MIWKLIDRLSKWLCDHGHHEFGEWRPNKWPARLMYDWRRECHRCGKSEGLGIGKAPPGMTHPAPSKWANI